MDPQPQRYHQLDAARALFMVLGVPFHAALAYAGGRWLVTSGSVDPLLARIAPVLSTFRMPGFFLIAGFFGAMLLQRRARRAWLSSRFERLGVPLLFGMVTIVPIQSWMLGRAPAGVASVPHAAGPAILSHLWFLLTLLGLCGALAAIWPIVRRLPDAKVSTRRLLISLSAFAVIYELGLRAIETLIGHDLVWGGGVLDLNALLGYAPYFVLGAWLRLAPRMFARFQSFDPLVALAGLVAACADLAVAHATTRPLMALDIALEAVAAICLAQTILSALGRMVTRGSTALDRMVDASFTIYLVHHPIIIGLAIAFTYLPWPPIVEWAIICAVALAVSYGAHRLIRRSPMLLWLMNGVPRRRAPGIVATASRVSPA